MKKIVRIIAAFFVSFFLLAMFMLLALLIAAPMVNVGGKRYPDLLGVKGV